MIIKTINPITIAGKRISKPSKYVSANGGDDDFYGFDSSGKPQNKEEVKQFQRWLVAKGVDISFKKKNGDIVSGDAAIDGDMKSGGVTDKAWGNYGAEFAKSIGLGGGSGTPQTQTPTATEPTKQEEVEQAKKGKVWDKAKGWVTSGKAADLLKQVQAAGGIKGFLQGFLGGGNAGGSGGNTTGGTVITTPPPITEDDKNKWSTGKKIAIFGGGAAVLGLIIYFATRGNK